MRILEEKPELLSFVLLSFLIHFIIIALVSRMVTTTHFDETPVEVFTVPDEASPAGKMRLADIAKPKTEKKPERSRFLGQYDSSVEHETTSTEKGVEGSGEQKIARRTVVGGGRSATRELQRKKPSTERIFAFNKSLFDDRRDQPREPDEKGGGGGGSLDDFYPDITRGGKTYLNVLRYPGIDYFVRLKHAFKTAFNPEPSLREHFRMTQVTHGSIDVVLGVGVGRSGELAELFVYRSSGIKGYDEEALRTVRASAPFATPPEKFLSADGQLRMSWTFSTYL